MAGAQLDELADVCSDERLTAVTSLKEKSVIEQRLQGKMISYSPIPMPTCLIIEGNRVSLGTRRPGACAATPSPAIHLSVTRIFVA